MFSKKIPSFFLVLLLFGGLFVFSCDSDQVSIERLAVTAYPNPFVNVVSIDLSVNAESEIRIHLYDQTTGDLKIKELNEGRVITKNPIVSEKLGEGNKKYRLDFSEMSDGLYFLDVVVDNKAQRVKLFKGNAK